MKQMSRFRNILAYVLVVVVLLWGLTVFTGAGRRDQVSYAAVTDCFRREQVVRFTVDGGGMLTLQSGEQLRFTAAKSMTATAYTTGYGGVGTRTASGTTVHVGTVAVDRKVIPLGTRLYIVTNDGFVYGLSVAEDTGVRGNTIDLYMDTNRECIQFGVRECTVYILD